MVDIEQVILFQIEKTNKIAKMYSQREFDKANLGITVDQWVLLKITQEKQPISQKELADFSFRDPASITRTLDLLEKKKLTRREAILDNRRQYNVSLTSEGESFVNRHMAMVLDQRKLSTDGFSDTELQQLMAMLLRIQDNFK